MIDANESPAAAYPGQGSKPYRAYVLFALLVVYTFNFIDRVVISIIQQPIKAEFGLSDFELGLLGGPAFAVLYTLLGIPIARLAEKQNRMTILAVCVAVWSAATALCGMAVSYGTLLAARVGVSIGEAGCTPPAQSVISDYFPADKRTTAISIYALGVPLGSLLAALGGGYIAEYLGWREAFLILGIPGLALAIIVKLTVREPQRAGVVVGVAPPSFVETFKSLAKKPTFWFVSLGTAVASFVSYGVGQYLNSFLMRTHELSLLQASQLTGVVLGVAAAIGTLFAGWLADRIVKRHPNALAWLPALGFGICTPLYIVGYMSTSLWVGIPFLVGAAITQYFYLGCMFAAVQGVAGPRMRATATAVLLFIVNILGYGLGPPVIGALSDMFANMNLGAAGISTTECGLAMLELNKTACAAGQEFGLRWAILVGVFGYLLAGVLFLFAWKTLRKDWVG
jgi:MFS family permease